MNCLIKQSDYISGNINRILYYVNLVICDGECKCKTSVYYLTKEVFIFTSIKVISVAGFLKYG